MIAGEGELLAGKFLCYCYSNFYIKEEGRLNQYTGNDKKQRKCVKHIIFSIILVSSTVQLNIKRVYCTDCYVTPL